MIKASEIYLTKKIPEISRLNLLIEEGESYVLLSSEDKSLNHLMNIFSGLEMGFSGTIEIDNIDIRDDWNYCKKNMVQITNGKEWPPDMRVGDFISFFKKKWHISEDEFEELFIKLNMDSIYSKRINALEEVEWRNTLLLLIQFHGCKNYIFKDFVKGMPLEFNLEFKKNIHAMKKKGYSILYLSNDVFLAPEIGDRIGFLKKGRLLLELKAAKMRKMSLKELYFQFLAES